MPDITTRRIMPHDIDNGFLSSLDSLRPSRDMDRERALAILKVIEGNPNHIVAVALVDNRVVGTATLLIEQKFIHNGGLAGHIEDVSVSSTHQRCGIGSALLEYLLQISSDHGCYKTTLDCDAELVPFYTGIGFKRHGILMRHDHR